jgi:hypothetical protein
MDHETANGADFSNAMDMNNVNGLVSPGSGNNNNEAKRVKLDKQVSKFRSISNHTRIYDLYIRISVTILQEDAIAIRTPSTGGERVREEMGQFMFRVNSKRLRYVLY